MLGRVEVDTLASLTCLQPWSLPVVWWTCRADESVVKHFELHTDADKVNVTCAVMSRSSN